MRKIKPLLYEARIQRSLTSTEKAITQKIKTTYAFTSEDFHPEESDKVSSNQSNKH
ncbi:hypothetical protein [Chryseobacterium sp. Leaf201]|uniref:hypothetical protein n=1 Tax=Chryseobacterium sp. Leaf201 TaxID=1735672 RepID=UPI00161E2C38|nr:hypothetical protein [Chryseobacterium sp. Leaf201]